MGWVGGSPNSVQFSVQGLEIILPNTLSGSLKEQCKAWIKKSVARFKMFYMQSRRVKFRLQNLPHGGRAQI